MNRLQTKQGTPFQLPYDDTPIPFGDDKVVPPPTWTTLTLQEGCPLIGIVDMRDKSWLVRWLWFAIPSGYVVRSRLKSDPPGGTTKLIYLHREVLKRHQPVSESRELRCVGDHLNGIPFDNRLENLRWASLSENAKNKHGAYYDKHGTYQRRFIW